MSIINIPANNTNADTVDGKHAVDFVSTDTNNRFGIGWKTDSVGTAINFRVDVTENLPVRKALEADTIINTLPISKGGTEATNVLEALKNLKILNTDFSNLPKSSIMMYSEYNDFNLPSMTMFEFMSHMKDNSSIIFRTSKATNIHITDIPTEFGLVFAIKCFNLNYNYVLYFSCVNSNVVDYNIYYWAANNSSVLVNWKKINDGGNADTLSNKHASDFIQNKVLLYTADANEIKECGEYYVQNCTNLPEFPGYLKVSAGYSKNWLRQTFSKFNGSAIYMRNYDNGVWSSWVRLNDGGNANTISGYDIHKLVRSSSGSIEAAWTVVSGEGAGIKFKVDATENLPVWKALEADKLDGKHASEFATASQITTINTTLNSKVDKVSGKGLSTNDFTAAYKTKLDNIAAGAEVNVQSDWNVTATNSNAFIKNKPTSLPANGGNADTVDGKHANEFATASQVTTISTTLNNKVDKVSGKGLSTNDFTAAYKSKLDGIQVNAKANVQSDWNVTATNSDAYIKNKPTSLPANGGNADTVDGKHASEFLLKSEKSATSSTIVIAASNSLAKNKTAADFVCTGSNDEIIIQSAINSLSDIGGKIIFLEGTYEIVKESIKINKPNVTFEGMGRATEFLVHINEGQISINAPAILVESTNFRIDGIYFYTVHFNILVKTQYPFIIESSFLFSYGASPMIKIDDSYSVPIYNQVKNNTTTSSDEVAKETNIARILITNNFFGITGYDTPTREPCLIEGKNESTDSIIIFKNNTIYNFYNYDNYYFRKINMPCIITGNIVYHKENTTNKLEGNLISGSICKDNFYFQIK